MVFKIKNFSDFLKLRVSKSGVLEIRVLKSGEFLKPGKIFKTEKKIFGRPPEICLDVSIARFLWFSIRQNTKPKKTQEVIGEVKGLS